MRRICLILLLSATLLLFLGNTAAASNDYCGTKWIEEFLIQRDMPDDGSETIKKSVLPISLTIVSEEAFEGTALSAVNLPNSVISVGDRAFSNNDQLLVVTLSDELTELQGNPFAGSQNVTLSGSIKSYGRDWALGHGIRYILEIRLAAKEEAHQFTYANVNKPIVRTRLYLSREKAIQQPKQDSTGRTNGELKAAAHDGGVAALYVQSRYFP